MSAAMDADVVVVGGGFFGLRIALFAREHLGADRVIVLEAESELMDRASYVNQARVHNGYHYPRSILTAYRSRASSAKWDDEYRPAVVDSFTHFYAIASRLSKVSARQFEIFCERIGAPLREESRVDVARVFAPSMVEKVWRAEEHAFDARILREIVLGRIRSAGGIDIRTGTRVRQIIGTARGAGVLTEAGETIGAPRVISSVYAHINELHRASGLELVPLQLELTEMALVSLPRHLRDWGLTVMDGPFFSVMPFPSRGLHTLSHVRYTPHLRWRDTAEFPDERPIPDRAALRGGATTFREMKADVARYVPSLARMEHIDSIREIKAVLAHQDHNDSRPILVRTDHGIAGYTCVMGGKIDNVNDVLEELAIASAPRGGTAGAPTHA